MAYSVDWIGKIISIPTADLTLVSGTRYQLAMADFLVEIRRLESAFDGGLWAPQILDHTNPKLDFSGVDYAGFDEVTNSYTIQITGAATRVDLVGSNNNIVDVLIATGVSVVPSNSAGLQLVETGVSGLTSEESALLDVIGTLQKYVENKREVAKNGSTWQIKIYDDDDTTPILTKDLKDYTGADITGLPAGVMAIEEASSV